MKIVSYFIALLLALSLAGRTAAKGRSGEESRKRKGSRPGRHQLRYCRAAAGVARHRYGLRGQDHKGSAISRQE